ncbi:MAG: DNA polymerase III subunit beta, partial [Alphaproteobacteria bacterium]|nr:DNA polymerase III subunit beta [Alphaproteobacteria bacterium]
MKVTIERAALLKALAHAQSVVERRNTIPILANIRLAAEDGKLSLTATDMDLSIVEETEVAVAGAGATTAPAHMLYDIARKLPEGAQVELDSTAKDGQLTLRAGRSTFGLASLPEEEFPVLAGGEQGHTFKVAARDLRSLIDRARFAISTEETRYYLNGIYLHEAENEGVAVLRAVATDGHRLARVEIPLPEGAAGMPGVIVPRKAVGEVRKLLDDATDEVQVTVSETKIHFVFGPVELTSKLIDGTFPDYQRVIPQGNDKTLAVDCQAFREAVDRVATISTERSRAVKLAIDDNTLTLSASSADSGTANEELEVEYGAGAMEIGFNARYLLDIAQQI